MGSPTGGELRASVGGESVSGQDEDLEGERLLKTSRLDDDVLTAEVSPQTHAEEREGPFRSAAEGERAVVVEISVSEPNVAREADVDVPLVDTSPTGEPLRASVGDARVIGQDDDVEGGRPLKKARLDEVPTTQVSPPVAEADAGQAVRETLANGADEKPIPRPIEEPSEANDACDTGAASIDQTAPPPKRPAVPLWHFLTQNRAKIMEEHKLVSVTELPRKAKELFDALSPETRRVYEELYEEEKRVFDLYMSSDAGKNDGKKERMAAKRLAAKNRRAKEKASPKVKAKAKAKGKTSARKKRRVPVSKPWPVTWPVLPLWQFMNEHREMILSKHGVSFTEVGNKAKELFEVLPSSERKVYEDRYLEQKSAFAAFKDSDEGKRFMIEHTRAKLAAKVSRAATLINRAKKERARAKNLKGGTVRKVKAPVPPVKQFLLDRRAIIAAEYGLTTKTELAAKSAELFEALPSARRKVYQDRYEKQKEAYKAFTAVEKKALHEYKKTVKASEREASKAVTAASKAATPKKRSAGTKGSPPKRSAKKLVVDSAVEISAAAIKQAAELGTAANGVEFTLLLQKLVSTPGFAGKVSQDSMLTTLQKHAGNVNLARNELRCGGDEGVRRNSSEG